MPTDRIHKNAIQIYEFETEKQTFRIQTRNPNPG